uniref:probable hexosyltransferase MUCI70 isoform X1 n=1 Tax=Erigeron canadensis TaxID=72917 RepID=UPI001CB9AE9B|nr:probable hexosyltransferase MUCI70 isoform X1 [Erigeron canadensis]
MTTSINSNTNGVSLDLRSIQSYYGSPAAQQQQVVQQNGSLQTQNGFIVRKASRMSLAGSREKDKLLPFLCRYLSRKKVVMMVLVLFALLAFLSGFFNATREDASERTIFNPFNEAYNNTSLQFSRRFGDEKDNRSSLQSTLSVCEENPPIRYSSDASLYTGSLPSRSNFCQNFAFPPPPPGDRRRPGPRPCPVCYLPVEEAMASMPSSPSISPVLNHLTYFHEESSTKTERHEGSDFGGYPSIKQRNESFNIKESMTVHCGFVKGCRPGYQTGFDIDVSDLVELEQYHDIIVASAIFGNYDVIQQPTKISEAASRNIPFYMFIDEETEAYMRNSSALDYRMKVGLWRIIVVHNIPYTDSRRNGKVPKLLLHRLFPNVRYSVWIDGKLQLVVDPYQLLERFLWRHNATFAISKHYRRFDVFEEAEANKAAGKYDNASIDYQIDFYRNEGLTPYSEAKLPIISDVPEGCVIIREHTPITNLFTCLWFNEVDRFTSRDQLSFGIVRDKIMAQVNWSINMFMDCERRNFVIQTYHRDLLEHMPPPAPRVSNLRRTRAPIFVPVPVSVRSNPSTKNLTKKPPVRRKGERKPRVRRHPKNPTNRDNLLF